MGWAYGLNDDGREIGYGVEAECDEPGCQAKIDRGLAYCCGGTPWSEYGCHGYFCGEHLFSVSSKRPQCCRKCGRVTYARIAQLREIRERLEAVGLGGVIV